MARGQFLCQNKPESDNYTGLKIMKRKIIVFSGEQYEKGRPPKHLLRFNEWLQNIIQEIPVDYQGIATIDVVTKLSDESTSYAAIEIAYQRENIDEKRQIQKELAELKRLKAKYDVRQAG